MISDLLKKIKEAVYGEEVRDSIHDAIEQCYKDATGHPDSVAATVKEIGEVSKRIDNLIATGTAQTQEIGKVIATTSQGSKIKINFSDSNVIYTSAFDTVKISDSLFARIDEDDGSPLQILKEGLYYLNASVEIKSEESTIPATAYMILLEMTDEQYNKIGTPIRRVIDFPSNPTFNIERQQISYLFKAEKKTNLRFIVSSIADTSDKLTFSIDDIALTALDWKGKQSADLSELHDLRIGADSTVYGTAGEAVRKQIGNLTEDLVNLPIENIQGISIKGNIVPILGSEWNDGIYTADSGQDVKYTETAGYYCFILQVRQNTNYISSNSLRLIVYLDSDKRGIGTKIEYSNTFNSKNASYIAISYSKQSVSKYNIDIQDGVEYTQDATTINIDWLKYLPKQKVYNSVLNGKKWVACGDSFTEYTAEKGGNYNDKSDKNYDFELGVFKTYPWWIAKRNGMTLINEAKSGSTITNTGKRGDAFSIERYKQIPKDADYITLKFGINDDKDHENAQIGTINDDTNTTFYGAWNVVMDYLVTNHPNAKIGIIATNGSFSNIVNAEIEIAKKYGVSYLNEGLGEDLPMFFRTSRTDIKDKIKNLFFNRYAINTENDWHPDVQWHEYESTIVESWLKKL